MKALRDRYGFLFWLQWICYFAGSFVAACLIWTFVIRQLFGPIRGMELTVTWAVSVFGSWFLLVTPFMRKKEQIWKRLNQDQEKAVDAWFFGMGILISLLIASLFFWTSIIHDPSSTIRWIKAVFASWLVIFIPFLILLYRMADKIFKEAVQRQTYTPRFRQVRIERSRRLLAREFSDRLRQAKPLLRGGHLVRLLLRDGKWVENVFILNFSEIAGVYGREEMGFESLDIADIKPIDDTNLPIFEESKWTIFY